MEQLKVAVITPTINSDTLAKCLVSVRDQTYQNLTHYIFIDGGGHEDMVRKRLFKTSATPKTKTIVLEENIGKGWYGHRVYAACSFLVNADIICYLDEDNWIEPNHVEKLVERIKRGVDWAYSLRKIHDKESNFGIDYYLVKH
jgi:glycosyltransferase involved in cell wall biosynthesis